MTLRASDACAPTCELLAASVERTAILTIALRRLAWAHHRTHSTPGGTTWPNCTDPMCQLAHEAIEGRYALNHPVPSNGRVMSIVKKEA